MTPLVRLLGYASAYFHFMESPFRELPVRLG